jgi:hypothetical protein
VKKVKRIPKMYNALANHKPGRQLGNWIGVEIECFIPYERIGKDVTGWTEAAKALAHVISAYKIPKVTVKADGSINSRNHRKFFETEITILFQRTNKAPLKKLCKLLNSLGAEVNKSCGLHVHLDCRDLHKAKINFSEPMPPVIKERGQQLNNALPLMLQMVSDSRKTNTYCRPRMAEDRTAINLGAFRKHKTIEVRLHNGTISFEKISNWIEFLYRSSRTSKSMEVKNVQDLKTYLGRAPKSLTSYIEKRIEILKETSAAAQKAKEERKAIKAAEAKAKKEAEDAQIAANTAMAAYLFGNEADQDGD